MNKEQRIVTNLDEEMEVDLAELMLALVKRWWMIIMGGLIGILLAGIYSYQVATPMYSASSAIYMRGSGNTVASLQDLQIGAELTNDYEEIFKSRPILEEVVSQLDLGISYKELRDKIQLSNPSDTRILRITVEGPDPTEAANIVNTLVKVGMDSVKEIDAKEPYLVEEAVADWDKISPSEGKNMVLGGLIGMIIVIGIVTFRFIMNDRIRTEEELEKVIQGPVLASLPESGVYNFERARKRKGNKKSKDEF